MTYLKRTSGNVVRCTILLQYIVRETFFAIRYDRPSLHTRTYTLSLIQGVAGICYAQYCT